MKEINVSSKNPIIRFMMMMRKVRDIQHRDKSTDICQLTREFLMSAFVALLILALVSIIITFMGFAALGLFFGFVNDLIPVYIIGGIFWLFAVLAGLFLAYEYAQEKYDFEFPNMGIQEKVSENLFYQMVYNFVHKICVKIRIE